MRRYAIPAGVFVAALALASAGCNNSELGCKTVDDCPSGHLCDSSICKKLCATDDDCVSGQHCDGEFCVEGGASIPTIEAVVGNSEAMCEPVAGAPQVNCVHDAIYVTGRNLLGASFELQDSDGTQDFALEVASNTDFSVFLVPTDPAALNTHIATTGMADYTLVVTNSAGSATQDVVLLQGEEGPVGPTGPPGPEGLEGPQGPDGPGGGGGNLWVCDDCAGVATPAVGLDDDRMVVTAAKVDGVASSTAVPHGELLLLCADGDGCTIELGLSGIDLDGPGTDHTAIETPYMGMPCRFFLDGSGNWSVSPHCYQRYGLISINQTIPIDNLNDILKFQPYESGWYGVDGQGRLGTDENWPVLIFWQLCLFGEAPANATVEIVNGRWDVIAEDDAPGFYLIAGDEAWWEQEAAGSNCPAEPDACWTGANRECVLIIED